MKFVTTAGSNIGSGHDEMPESGHRWTPCKFAACLFHSRRDLITPFMWGCRGWAKIPTMVAAFDARKGNDPVRPRDDLITPPTFCIC